MKFPMEVGEVEVQTGDGESLSFLSYFLHEGKWWWTKISSSSEPMIVSSVCRREQSKNAMNLDGSSKKDVVDWEGALKLWKERYDIETWSQGEIGDGEDGELVRKSSGDTWRRRRVAKMVN